MARPLTKKLRLARNLLLLGLVAIATPTAVKMVRDFERDDPIGALLVEPMSDSKFLMRMEGVRMKHYDAKGLVTYANADLVDMLANRDKYELHGISDAMYRGKEGNFRYAAAHATFDESLNELVADGDVRVQNKDMDLRAKQLRYFGQMKHLLVKGDVVGKLKGGDVKVQNVDYRLDNGAFTAGPLYWKGMLALNLQDDAEDGKPRPWSFQADQMKRAKGSPEVTYTNAVAADDEVIIIAPQVVHNEKTDVLTATGRVQYFSAKANFVGDKCVVYRKEKRAELVGGVLMYVKPKQDQTGKPKVETLPTFQPLNPAQVTVAAPGKKLSEEEKKQAEELRNSKNIRQFPTTMVAAKVDYWYGKGARRAVITGSPQGRQELSKGRWRHVWSNVAFYDGEKETLKLVSTKGLKDTILKDSVGDDMKADWMEVSTEEENDEMTGFGFVGTMIGFSDEDETGSKDAVPNPTLPPKADSGKSAPPKKGTGGDPKKNGGGKG